MMLSSPFVEKLDRSAILNEYPRMQLRRGSFHNLNGVWQYVITNGNRPDMHAGWKNILVPFAPGSALSGTSENLMPHQTLWYRRYFHYIPETHHTILNFEAVDQCCTVYINGVEAGSHEGGYTPFCFDITSLLQENNEILVKVSDDSDQSLYAWGKQKISHGGMWYTPSAGIYQTVWLEDLPDRAITDVKITPDYDHHCVYLRMAGTFTQAVITVFDHKELVHRGITSQRDYTISMDSIHAWSPEDPFLYDLYIQTEDETIKSYFAMRKFSAVQDRDGHMRFALNNNPLFLSGVLDQGYNVDGGMTYPSEEAMIYDILKMKELGFNMIRKHVKVECRRWYYLCDLYGMLVMQDIPNGGNGYSSRWTLTLPQLGFRRISDQEYEQAGRSSEQSRNAYYKELDDILDDLYNCPCIFAWTAFNEGWGQFDSQKVTDHIKVYDTTRLVDSASGWHDQGAGDFNSRHCYFHSFHEPTDDGRITLLSEFGGYTYLEAGHSEPSKLYGYRKFKDKLKYNEAVMKLYENDVEKNIPKGLSGCVYTQSADIEDECNGIMSADRRITKLDEKRMRRMNERCIRSVKK